MKGKRSKFSKQYCAALLAYLEEGRKANPESASGLGNLASAAGVQLLDLAHLHEQTLVTEVLPKCPPGTRADVLKKAGMFFAVAIIPTHQADGEHGSGKPLASVQLEEIMGTLSERTVELAAANLELNREIAQRKAMEKALRAKESSHAKSLEKSARLQQQLRSLSRRLLSAQEDERKKISRELHDVIGQTLAGINIHLGTLKKEAALTTKTLGRNIARTQRLVEKSAGIVNDFARELRPAILDDLGLIPALHSFMKAFTERTGVRTRLIAVAEVEKLDANRRTTLFRIAQEALANVARHAQATRASVTIKERSGRICMTIKDDGRSFQVEKAISGRGRKRLGLLGMRERVEMVGGHFSVESTPGKGTTITATVSRPKRAKTMPIEATETDLESV